MMEHLLTFIQNHAEHAHFFLFALALLAGLNVPISIDLLMIAGATLAATILPQNLYLLFFSLFLGCVLSAWIAFFLGRLLGSKLMSKKWMLKVQAFYQKRGPIALVLGRFIPFGVRNALYMSSGMSKLPFARFALWDGLACLLWSVLSFSLYYAVGKNIDTLHSHVKSANIAIFGAFSVTVIGIIWYKKRKTIKEKNV